MERARTMKKPLITKMESAIVKSLRRRRPVRITSVRIYPASTCSNTGTHGLPETSIQCQLSHRRVRASTHPSSEPERGPVAAAERISREVRLYR